MTSALIAIAAVTLATAAIAMMLRNIIHSALLLIGSWAGIAAFYLWAGAEFVGFAQLMVYVGAVSMVVLFAVLLTQHSAADVRDTPSTRARVLAALIAGGSVLGVLVGAVLSTRMPGPALRAPAATVKDIGTQLMGPHAASLLIVGVLLTVALLGAIVIASADRPGTEGDES
jgi:NADH:ubiquinone oxidoreductase subunit 6 (subunit J)